jgi:hypothetical protein
MAKEIAGKVPSGGGSARTTAGITGKGGAKVAAVNKEGSAPPKIDNNNPCKTCNMVHGPNYHNPNQDAFRNTITKFITGN